MARSRHAPSAPSPGCCLRTDIYRTIYYMVNRIGRTVRRPRGHTRAKTYRFDARLNEEQKLLLQRAADLEGRTLTDFVLQSARTAAERAIERHAMLVLSGRDTEAFVDAILSPAEPGPVLRQAAREYREKTRRR